MQLQSTHIPMLMADAFVPDVLQSGVLSQAVLHALDQLGLAVLIKDVASGRYDHANDIAARMFGLQAPTLVGAMDSELFDVAQAVALRAADHQAQSVSSGLRTEHKLELSGGRHEFITWRQVVAVEGDRSPKLLSVWQDVTESRRQAQQLQAAMAQLEQQQKANDTLRRDVQDNQVRDVVSGLYHRAHFEEQLRREADLSSREQREFALVSIAIDNIDEIRRLHGDTGCERVVEALGRLLRVNTRAMDSPCRLAGDRFVVLLSGIGLAIAHSRMEQFRRQCVQHIVPYNGQQIPFTVCMGVASFPHTAGGIDELMNSADKAMNTARQSGNRIVLASIEFSPSK